MEFIISLTFEDESLVSKLLSSKLAVYLGRIAYGESAAESLYIPIWCIPVVWIISIILGILLNRFIEEPLRKKLRPARVEKKETSDQLTGGETSEEEEEEEEEMKLVVGAE